MRRILITLMALMVFPIYSVAEITLADLSGMSYDELVDLKDTIDLAIWSSNEWQEVQVPYGVWVVGEDIPAGKWTIKPVDWGRAYIHWGSRLNASGTDVDYGGSKDVYECEWIYDEWNDFYTKGNPTSVTWDLKEGQFFVVKEGIVVFSPYSGKLALGFK